MEEVEAIIEKGKKLLENGTSLIEGLTRKEYIIFLRHVKRPKINELFLPYIEIESWTVYSKDVIVRLMEELKIPTYRNRNSWSVPSLSYPYKQWYVHNDGSIQIGKQKLKKLLEDNNYPISIKLKNIQYNDEIENPNPFGCYGINEENYKKISDKIAEKATELTSLYSKIDELVGSLSGEAASTAKTMQFEPEIKYDTIEFSSPALKSFKTLRDMFFLFKTKGLNKTPCLFVNKSCGLHISFLHPTNVPNYTKRLIHLFGVLEEQIYKIVPDHRKNNQYCRKLDLNLDLNSLEDCINNTKEKYSSLYSNKNGGKFQEFRFINATSNVTQIENWILFLQSLCEYAHSTAEITEDLHLFDVVTNPILQDWYIRRREHLTLKASEDKNTDSQNLEPFINIKLKRDELKKSIEQSKEKLNTPEIRTVNSPVNQRQPISSLTRSTNLQAARNRIRNRRY